MNHKNDKKKCFFPTIFIRNETTIRRKSEVYEFNLLSTLYTHEAQILGLMID